MLEGDVVKRKDSREMLHLNKGCLITVLVFPLSIMWWPAQDLTVEFDFSHCIYCKNCKSRVQLHETVYVESSFFRSNVLWVHESVKFLSNIRYLASVSHKDEA